MMIFVCFIIESRIAAAVFSVLREDLTSIKKTVTNISDRVDLLAQEFESSRAELHSSLLPELALSVLHNLLPYLNSIEAHIGKNISNINDTVNSLHRKLKNQFMNESQKLESLQEEMSVIQSNLEMVNSELNDVNIAVSNISNNFEEHDTKLASDLIKIRDNLTEYIGYTCGATTGWRRVAYIDMRDTNVSCPSGWQLLDDGSLRTCGRISERGSTCDSVFFPVPGGPYSQVCGRIRAYQWGLTRAFSGFTSRHKTVDSAYFSGVAIMHGNPLQHIWTFAAGEYENQSSSSNCPCDATSSTIQIPQFVGEDYFCESGYIWPGYSHSELHHFHFEEDTSSIPWYRLHSNDTLWDGENCHNTSNCCSHHNPPYFTKILDHTTTDDLELRMCLQSSIDYENIQVEFIELYVKQDYTTAKISKVNNEMIELFMLEREMIDNTHVHTCGGTGGWREVVNLDMTYPYTNCPSGWQLNDIDSKRICSRARDGWESCDSAFFPVSGGEYSQVCGRIRAYQWGINNAFYGYYREQNTIENAYVSGLSLTHSSPRQHIWTFAAGRYENSNSRGFMTENCPCDISSTIIPPYVGEDYFCESGQVVGDGSPVFGLYINDTLWDGKDCHSSSTCCSLHNPPYFTKSLNQPTTDDLELRICTYWYFKSTENIGVELVELFVK